ncbi:MAG: hypothetical protein GXP06_08800 [Alphaproteobacteria bacterium]|nr:hypothetical protein [Alphaproteobacteria bacterium]
MGPAVILIAILIVTIVLFVIAQIIHATLRLFRLAEGRFFVTFFRWTPILIGLILVALVIATFLVPAFLSPDDIYEKMFSEKPSDTISIIESKASGGIDFFEAYLVFTTPNPSEMETRTSTMQVWDNDKDQINILSVRGPVWWDVEQCVDREVFVQYDVSPWDTMFVINCRSNTQYYAYAIWVD